MSAPSPYDWQAEGDFTATGLENWSCPQLGHISLVQERTCLACGEDVTTPDTFAPQCRPAEDA